MNPLELYNQTAEDMGVTDELNASPVARLSFAREQANQMKSIVNRLLFDLTITKAGMNEAKDEDSKASYKNKVAEYEGQLRQTKKNLTVVLQLVKELEDVVNEG